MTNKEKAEENLSRDEKLKISVRKVVEELEKKYLSDTREPSALARLARLRRATTAAPGSVPEVWEDTIGTLDGSLLGKGDEPSLYEYAAHQAITMFALHRQSGTNPVHVRKVSLGSAVRKLAGTKGYEYEGPIRKRFLILATAESREEIAHHLRGMIGLLRAEDLPLDYGLLAVDIRKLLVPSQSKSVQLHWGRDYYGSNSNESDSQESDS
ncbi:MAG: type I-E CRISPR-associated protein Cse2/CasB [Mycobacteriaceae bacterium]